MNRKRHPDYIRLKKLINECTKLTQLENLRQVVSETNKLMKGTKWEEDGIDLMILFVSREAEIEGIIDAEFERLSEAKIHARKFQGQ